MDIYIYIYIHTYIHIYMYEMDLNVERTDACRNASGVCLHDICTHECMYIHTKIHTYTYTCLSDV